MDLPAGATLTLVVEKGPRKGETVDCRPGGRVRIGRVVRRNNFPIKDSGISQQHLSIEAVSSGAGWAVTDLGSSNGTLLNDVRIEPSAPAPLRDGDAIKIGEETAIRVRIAEVVAEASMPPAAAGPRRNPRRGRAAAAAEEPREGAGRRNPRRGRAASAAEEPREGAGGPAREKARPRRAAAAGGDAADDEERADPMVKESAKKPKKKAAARRGRGRGAPKEAAAAPTCLGSVSQESEKEDLGAVESKILKEVKQEIPDSVEILSVKAPEAGVRRGRGAPRGAKSVAGAPEEEQERVDVDRVGSLREEEEEAEVAEANSGVWEAGVDMENMTLEEWFDRMEKYLPKVINEIAEEVIAEIKAKAERFNKHVGNSLDSEQQDTENGFLGLR